MREAGQSESKKTYVAVGLDTGLDAHVRAEHDLERVVDELHRAGLDGRHAGLHHERADDDERQVGDADRERGRKVHERVVLHRRELVALARVEPREQRVFLDVRPLLVGGPELGGHGACC